jgi:hypothetical protein
MEVFEPTVERNPICFAQPVELQQAEMGLEVLVCRAEQELKY